MKKILAIAIVTVLTVALCVSANAQLNIDRLFINANDLNEGTDVKANDPIEINAGDKVYILGWAANPDGALKEIVWSVDGGADQKCSDIYRDRSDVAGAGIAIADNGTHGGFGIDAAADGGMMELLGIGSVAAGAHVLTIKAVYADGTSESLDYNISVSGESSQPAAEKDPDTWLCKAGGTVATGWWMHPFTDQEWEINFKFTTPNAFEGFVSTLFANPEGATVKINVLDADGNVLDTVEHTQAGDGLATITFNKAFAPGTYTIQFKSTDNGAHFVVGSSEAGDIPVEISGNGNTNESTLAAPIILLTGAVNPGSGSTPSQPSNPKTADAAVIAIAAVAVVALAGVVVAKKVR